MAKREKLEIIYDILNTIRSNKNMMKLTPLLRKSNLSSTRFKEYYAELLHRNLLKEAENEGSRHVSVTEKGFRFLEKYHTILDFIDEFEL